MNIIVFNTMERHSHCLRWTLQQTYICPPVSVHLTLNAPSCVLSRSRALERTIPCTIPIPCSWTHHPVYYPDPVLLNAPSRLLSRSRAQLMITSCHRHLTIVHCARNWNGSAVERSRQRREVDEVGMGREDIKRHKITTVKVAFKMIQMSI